MQLEALKKPTEIPVNLFKPKSPTTARVLENRLLTPAGEEEVCHITLELAPGEYPFVEGQSLGVLPPGEDKKGKPHKLRLYSIASSRGGDAGKPHTVALCVKRVAYVDEATGEKVYGVASNYICDRKPGDELQVTGPAGKKFVLPDDPEADLILMATGTGIAPFRAFLYRIYQERPDFQGRCLLLYGAKYARELIYMNEFNRDLAEFEKYDSFQMVTALSREYPERGKVYVQHRLLENAQTIREMMDRGNFAVYICGLKGMDTGIEDSMEKILAEQGGVSWADCKSMLKKTERWNVEVY